MRAAVDPAARLRALATIARLRALAAIAALICAVAPLRAETYPSRPIKLVTPFPPGGPVDVMARLVAQGLSQRFGTVIVDNRPGAGGTIGSRGAAAAEPDGYTLLFGSSTTLAASPALYQNIGYDPIKSFTPVAMISSVPFAIVVSPKLPVHSVQDLIAYAKQHPGKLNYGAPTGALPHLTGEMFKTAAGVDIVHVPYKGAAMAMTDLIGGQVEVAFEPYSVLLGHIADGSVRALAVAGETRSPDLPDVPTMIESGYPGVVSVSWSAIVAPAGTPAEIVARLNAAVNAVIAAPETRATLAKLGATPKPGTPEDLGAYIAAETPKWAAVVKAAHIKIE